MDMEEVYLRQITEHLKRQNELQEENNKLLKELFQNLGINSKIFCLDVKAREV